MAKMTKTQVRFRSNRMMKDINFLFLNSPDWCQVSSKDVETIHKIAKKYLRSAK